MINATIDEGQGTIQVAGDLSTVLTDLSIIVFDTLKRYANNEQGFNELRDIFIIGLNYFSYNDIKSDDEKAGT